VDDAVQHAMASYNHPTEIKLKTQIVVFLKKDASTKSNTAEIVMLEQGSHSILHFAFHVEWKWKTATSVPFHPVVINAVDEHLAFHWNGTVESLVEFHSNWTWSLRVWHSDSTKCRSRTSSY
jgi:hypothetical protein